MEPTDIPSVEARNWLEDVEFAAADIIGKVQRLRDRCRELDDIPPQWYVLTEVMLAIQSAAYALEEVSARPE